MPRQTFVLVTGVREIDNRLQKIEPKLQRKALSQSIRAGLKVIAQAVKVEAPIDTGLTKRKVQVRALKKRKRGDVALECRIGGKGTGLYRTSDKSGKTVFYPAVVEYGRLGVPPNPFMRRAFESHGEAARETTVALLKSSLDSIIAGLSRS